MSIVNFWFPDCDLQFFEVSMDYPKKFQGRLEKTKKGTALAVPLTL
jgi:hypothetical protein